MSSLRPESWEETVSREHEEAEMPTRPAHNFEKCVVSDSITDSNVRNCEPTELNGSCVRDTISQQTANSNKHDVTEPCELHVNNATVGVDGEIVGCAGVRVKTELFENFENVELDSCAHNHSDADALNNTENIYNATKNNSNLNEETISNCLETYPASPMSPIINVPHSMSSVDTDPARRYANSFNNTDINGKPASLTAHKRKGSKPRQNVPRILDPSSTFCNTTTNTDIPVDNALPSKFEFIKYPNSCELQIQTQFGQNSCEAQVSETDDTSLKNMTEFNIKSENVSPPLPLQSEECLGVTTVNFTSPLQSEQCLGVKTVNVTSPLQSEECLGKTVNITSPLQSEECLGVKTVNITILPVNNNTFDRGAYRDVKPTNKSEISFGVPASTLNNHASQPKILRAMLGHPDTTEWPKRGSESTHFVNGPGLAGTVREHFDLHQHMNDVPASINFRPTNTSTTRPHLTDVGHSTLLWWSRFSNTPVPESVGVNSQTLESPHKCDICGTGSTDISSLALTPEKLYACAKCVALRDQFSYEQQPRIDLPYKCTECDEAFKNKRSLAHHSRTHGGIKPYNCGECGATFARKGHLITHNLLHTGEKPYKCKDCDAAFTHKTSLKDHTLQHTGEKPYKCLECGAAFGRKGHLNTHSLIHSGKTPHQCHICGNSFTHKMSLQDHMLQHTGQKPHKCPECGAAFTRKGHLTTHSIIHTRKRLFLDVKNDADANTPLKLDPSSTTDSVDAVRKNLFQSAPTQSPQVTNPSFPKQVLSEILRRPALLPQTVSFPNMSTFMSSETIGLGLPRQSTETGD